MGYEALNSTPVIGSKIEQNSKNKYHYSYNEINRIPNTTSQLSMSQRMSSPSASQVMPLNMIDLLKAKLKQK